MLGRKRGPFVGAFNSQFKCLCVCVWRETVPAPKCVLTRSASSHRVSSLRKSAIDLLTAHSRREQSASGAAEKKKRRAGNKSLTPSLVISSHFFSFFFLPVFWTWTAPSAQIKRRKPSLRLQQQQLICRWFSPVRTRRWIRLFPWLLTRPVRSFFSTAKTVLNHSATNSIVLYIYV